MPGCVVLVVDDDPDIRESISDLLSSEGHDVQLARNGQEALGFLRAHPAPCMILLDLMMPVMNGWQFAREKATDPALALIPVCVITAAGPTQPPPDDVMCVLRKPFRADELLRVVGQNCC